MCPSTDDNFFSLSIQQSFSHFFYLCDIHSDNEPQGNAPPPVETGFSMFEAPHHVPCHGHLSGGAAAEAPARASWAFEDQFQ